MPSKPWRLSNLGGLGLGLCLGLGVGLGSPVWAKAAEYSANMSEAQGSVQDLHLGQQVDLWRLQAPAQRPQGQAQRAQVPVPGPQTVTADVQFRVVSAVDFRALPGARVVLIGPDGRLLQTGLTDSEGIWRTRVTVQRDPKYPDLGFATALCVATGYNETVIYNVPVRQGTAQPVTLNPIQPGLRNEPMAMLGQIHRLDVIDLVTRYGAALGLQRQAPIPGEQGYAPWGPQLSPR